MVAREFFDESLMPSDVWYNKRFEEIYFINWIWKDNWDWELNNTYAGTSIHKSLEDKNEYIQNHWKNMPDHTPETYSRPILDAIYHTKINKDIFNLIGEEKGLELNFPQLGYMYKNSLIQMARTDMFERDINNYGDTFENKEELLENIIKLNKGEGRTY